MNMSYKNRKGYNMKGIIILLALYSFIDALFNEHEEEGRKDICKTREKEGRKRGASKKRVSKGNVERSAAFSTSCESS